MWRWTKRGFLEIFRGVRRRLRCWLFRGLWFLIAYLQRSALLREDSCKLKILSGVFFCGLEDELVTHLFLGCDVSNQVWRGVMIWIEFNLITPPNLFIHIISWSSAMGTKKLRKGAQIIWYAVIWMIWKMRNDIIFNSKVCGVDELVGKIKVISWHWSINRLKIASCLFYEWCWNPREWLLR